ncbi:type IV secretory system conjugative DNA transfer family protein [Mucilaginibacter psychrotolerans]|uniref:Type IV secretory system conjugative DNA transfer family protein n=1 Tax=Mucilaginibacter psychrotolerans TaxID=1524096 RepID=A0A4Y8SHA4_9SPHI|nr:type IV secretory system conjugative DNA transfer family protein [Mucilaginibacter psychrotolerans]TFF37927.1 type IV secretory system conjugative DNA transfer family protein [Mucilaginibacter psychrotolerans]
MPNNSIKQKLDVTSEQLEELFRSEPSPEALPKLGLFLLGTLLTPITLGGALLGYGRAYNRFFKPRDIYPRLYNLPPIVRVAMLIGAVAIWVVILILFFFFITASGIVNSRNSAAVVAYLLVNLLFTCVVYGIFANWRRNKDALAAEMEKFGTARFAHADELQEYDGPKGFYIGGGYTFADKGHLLTVAGTRGGKGTNLIVPNLLGVGGYEGSYVVIDPKAELAAITGRYQRESGKNVVILNPWDLLSEHVGQSSSYNPLDILSDKSSPHLIDDADIIAEMIVPVEKDDKNKFFTDNARGILSGLVLHLATTHDKRERTLEKLWKWVRLSGDDWDNLLADMAINIDPVNGEAIRTSANAILQLMKAGDKTFGSIMATLIQCTDFLKSPSLQKSMQSGFDPATLSEGNTIVYVVIPVDKLQSHARWLRLVVTTCMRAVVRKPNKRVCFLLDEFAALGYLPEIENALSTYAGFNLTVWAILQSLIQLKGIYGDKWEVFVGNTAVKQYFSVNDNFTADYISTAIGQTSHITGIKSRLGLEDPKANARPLVAPDEVRRGSGDAMFVFIGAKPPTLFAKQPYYQMGEEMIGKDGKARFDKNPYL